MVRLRLALIIHPNFAGKYMIVNNHDQTFKYKSEYWSNGVVEK